MPDISADELRRLLQEAAGRGDEPGLVALCRAHRELIVRSFPHWRTVPAELRSKPEQAEGYIQTVAAVARVFEKQLNDPSLLQQLVGTARDNPLIRWQQRLEAAQRNMEQFHYRETIRDLEALLDEVGKLQGSGAALYLPITYGLLGDCYFHTGQAEKAVAPTEEALRRCRETGDAEGVVTYLGNLYEIHRYRGAAQRAADYAEELADELDRQGQRDEAERYRRQAALVRKGEPLNRVIVNLDGKRRELEEVLALADADHPGREPGAGPGRTQFAFERNRLTLRPAQVLTRQGEQQAEQGRFEAALGLFQQAAEADAYDPQCRYQAGLTLLYLGQYAAAVQAYEQVEERAPGWFQCRSHAWLAREMHQGAVSHEVFQLWHVAEDGPLSPAQKLNVVERALQTCPDLALLHHQRGKSLRAMNLGPAAESAYREGLECAQEADVRSRLLVDLAGVVSDPAERQRLEETVALNGNLVATATARIVLAFAEGREERCRR